MKNFFRHIFTATLIFTFIFSCLPAGKIQVHAGIQENIVSYTPNTITKGFCTTPIWNQHRIWKKGCGAANHGCGLCTASMALVLNGVPSNPNIVLNETGRKIRGCKPFYPAEATRYIRSKGINAFLFNSRLGTRSDHIRIMNNALQEGKLVMVMVKGYPFSNGYHWILLTGFTPDGKVVVANSSNGGKNILKKTGKQYQIASWSLINKRLLRRGKKWSHYIVIGN